MYGTARIGDRTIGVCVCHDEPIIIGGKIITGSQNTTVNNRLHARIGDTVLADCGHTGTLVTGKTSVTVNGRIGCQLGSLFEGCYSGEVISASDNDF